MQTYLTKFLDGEDLSEAEAFAAMGQIMDGNATPAQIGAFLTALRLKRETVDEITGFARAMRDRSVRVPSSRSPLVDTCGTGGDLVKTFNISTAAAFVAAGGGVAVAKHGNRSVTSKCGSADVLEALGARLDLTPGAVGNAIDTVGIGFLFARSHHPAMKHAAPIRAELGFRTIFNALGPLTNPAGATRQVVGVYHPDLCEPMARVLLNLGSEHVLVVHAFAGLDEIATFGVTRIAEGKDGEVHVYTVTAATFGLPESTPDAVAAGCDAAENADLLRSILEGRDTGACRDIVLANAAAALYVAGEVSALTDGIERARALIASGAARDSLNAFVTITQALAGGTPV